MNKFEKAFEMSMNDWLSTIPDIVPEAEYTKNHDKWLKNLLNKMRDNKYHTFTTKTIKVLLVAAVLCALLLTAFVVPSSRKYIIDNFDVFSRYKITENNKNSVNGEITVGYIPEGFTLVSKESFSKHIVQYYSAPNNDILIIHKYPSSMEVDFNTEDINTEIIVIDNRIYTYSLSNDICNLIWSDNDYIYRINGTVLKDELLKIAETVK